MGNQDTRWGRPPQVWTLVAFDLLGSAVCLLGALRPVPGETSVARFAWAASLGVSLATLVWATGRRAPAALRHLNVAALLGTTLVLIARAVTPEGATAMSITFVALAMYVTAYLPRVAARVYVAVMVVGVLAALHLNDGVLLPNRTWLPVAIATVATSEVLAGMLGRIHRLTLTDPLTGALNRTGFYEAVARERAIARRSGQPLAVVVIDLDGFKAVNDRHGHAAGDALLASLVSEWRARLRPGDAIARRGGDEFALLLPGTSWGDAELLASRMRQASPATWSYGVAALAADDDLEEALHRADEAMYAQKAAPEAPPSVTS